MKLGAAVEIQQDDGDRNALNQFMKNRDENTLNHLIVLKDAGQYWKGRVLLELLWEYENQLKGKSS